MPMQMMDSAPGRKDAMNSEPMDDAGTDTAGGFTVVLEVYPDGGFGVYKGTEDVQPAQTLDEALELIRAKATGEEAEAPAEETAEGEDPQKVWDTLAKGRGKPEEDM